MRARFIVPVVRHRHLLKLKLNNCKKLTKIKANGSLTDLYLTAVCLNSVLFTYMQISFKKGTKYDYMLLVSAKHGTTTFCIKCQLSRLSQLIYSTRFKPKTQQ